MREVLRELSCFRIDLDRIFVCTCGLTSSCISLVRVLMVKQKTIELNRDFDESETEESATKLRKSCFKAQAKGRIA